MSGFDVIQGQAVVLEYSKLIAGEDLSNEIALAYGNDGLGILTVSGIPGLTEAREALLPLARRFAELPEEVKAKYVHEESSYSFGWSHGKEKLDGNFDLSKGSYYGNPQYDRPVDDEELIAKYSPFIHPNIWPTDDLPELEAAFKDLGRLIVAVGTLVASQCDRYVKKQCGSYSDKRLTQVIEGSLCCKARLLHYFDCSHDLTHENGSSDSHDPFSSWCGWHNDHGSLTGLVSAMFLDAEGNVVQNTDPNAGLYCRNRKSELVKVSIPQDHLAFQIGETAQVHSGGLLQATPHAVRGSNVPGVTRETFAVFMEPNWDEKMTCPDGIDPSQAQTQSAAENLPRGVPPLKSRWNCQQDFGEFTAATLSSYY